jgi:hypothetical protein
MTTSRSVSAERMLEYIRSTEVESHHRHASRRAESGLGFDFFEYAWPKAPVAVDVWDRRFVEDLIHPASARDVARYAKQIAQGAEVLPIVLMDKGSRFALVDGAHRLAAARVAGMTHIMAYIGKPPRGAR